MTVGFADSDPPPATNPVVFGGDNGNHVQETRHAYVWGTAGSTTTARSRPASRIEAQRQGSWPGPERLGVHGYRRLELRRRRIAGVYEHLNYDTLDRQPEAQLLGRQRHGPDRSGNVVCVLRQGGRRRGRRGSTARASRGPDEGLGHGLATSGKISYTYPLSKRTQVYAGYVKLDNDGQAAYTFNINAYRSAVFRAAAKPNGKRSRARHDPPVLSSKASRSPHREQSAAGAFGRPLSFADASRLQTTRVRRAGAAAPSRCDSQSTRLTHPRLRSRAANAVGHRRGRAARRRAPNLPEADLAPHERRHAAGLMRVNHTGEVCAQALYAAQALVARDPASGALRAAAREEEEHLAWTQARLAELGDRASLRIRSGTRARSRSASSRALAGDRVNLGFVVETERQVEEHLTAHIDRLPATDAKSRAIVDADARRRSPPRRDGARSGRACRCPSRSAALMRAAADVMRAVAYRI